MSENYENTNFFVDGKKFRKICKNHYESEQCSLQKNTYQELRHFLVILCYTFCYNEVLSARSVHKLAAKHVMSFCDLRISLIKGRGRFSSKNKE